MHQLNHKSFALSSNQFIPTSIHHQSQSGSGEKDNTTARKNQKAGREKLRRDRLNEQFLELGKVLDPDRPKNDKASILTDTIQVVADLNAQVNGLKAEFATLTEESRELTQEKNDLREEKATLKSDIESLNVQCQHRLRSTYPWGAVDHSMVMHPSPYPMHVPVPMHMPTGPIPMPMPTMQPYPFFGAQNHGVIPNPCSTYVPYVNHSPMIEQQSIQQGARTHVSTKQGARDKLSEARTHVSTKQAARDELSNCRVISAEKSEASNDVMTELGLKTPGSATNENSSSPQTKLRKLSRKGNEFTRGSSSNKCSSSNSVQDGSSSSVVGGGKVDG